MPDIIVILPMIITIFSLFVAAMTSSTGNNSIAIIVIAFIINIIISVCILLLNNEHRSLSFVALFIIIALSSIFIGNVNNISNLSPGNQGFMYCIPLITSFVLIPYLASTEKATGKKDYEQPIVKIRDFSQLIKTYKLSNNNCKASYSYEEKKIYCFNQLFNKYNEKEYVVSSLEYHHGDQSYMNEVWLLICEHFTNTTTFENISESLYKSGLKTETHYLKNEKPKTEYKNNLLDINSATEKEIAALPGINIIMAKKAIKYIWENNGFKSVDEFLDYLKIKEPFRTNIQNVICVKPIESKNDDNEPPQNDERTVDL